jgi:hypothetical protein
MVGFYRQRRLVLEDHFSPAFQYDQDFFVFDECCVFRLISECQDHQPSFHGDTIRRAAQQLQLILPVVSSSIGFGDGF